MTDNGTQTTRGRSSAGRVGLIVAGALAGLLALGALGLGAAALWADDEKNERGYLMTDSERFATGARALATDNLDVDLSGAGWLVDTGDLGRVELEVSPEGGEPVFAGIARTEDVGVLSARRGPHARHRRRRLPVRGLLPEPSPAAAGRRRPLGSRSGPSPLRDAAPRRSTGACGTATGRSS